MSEVLIRDAVESDLADVARLHIEAFPGSVLGDLGEEAVRRNYLWQLTGPHDLTALVANDGGDLLGFLFGGVFRGSTIGFVKSERWFLARQVAHHPRILLRGVGWSRVALALRLLARRTAPAQPEQPEAVPRRSLGVLAIAVDPAAQGRGVGRALMAEVAERARAQGFEAMHLTVHPSNEQALTFYRSLGWSELLEADGRWVGRMTISLSSPGLTVDRGVARLLVWSLLGAVTLALGYLVMVRLGAGQWLDDVALDGRKSTRLAARRAVATAVRVLTPAAVVVVTGWSVVVAVRLRGAVAALAAGAATVATLALARTLKAGLPRDDMLVETFVGPENSYPSGHTAVASTLALMAISVSPPRWRARVSAVAAVAIGCHTVGMAGTGWHRPSDLVGGIGLAVMISAIASVAVVRSWRGAEEDAPTPWFASRRRVELAVALAVAISFTWYVVIRLLGTSSYGSFKAHLVLTLATVALAVGVVVAHSRLVDATDLGKVRSEQGSGGREH